MGDCSVHFDKFDSLDYLIPPVKKSNGTLETNLLFSRDFKKQTDIRLTEDFRTRTIRSPSISHESEAHTSSVLLKKTTEELIHEQYCFINSNDKNWNTTKRLPINKECKKKITLEDKPMIKVTVTPKAGDTQTSKIFNKRRERKTKLQSTVSNQESSIKRQNIYFMVKGKRKEKVYEIKSTESTNLSNKFLNTKYEDISIERVTNSKRLISSLNMEKKIRKNKKIEINNHGNFGGTCQNIKNKESEGVNVRKSKVTIIGQLGLTRDDQYVLKCAATVNDKPIATNYVQLDNTTNKNISNINRNAQGFTSKFATTGVSLDNNDDYRTRCQDSNVQTDIGYANNCINFDSNRKDYRNNSQATQVNFNQPKHKSPKGFKNKVAQCNCDISTTENNAFNVGIQDNVPKDCKTPLVIISVYPRQCDKEDNNNLVKIIQRSISPQKISNNLDYNKSKAKKGQLRENNAVSVNKSEQKSPRSRSPSPATKTLPNKNLNDKTGYQVLRMNNNMINFNPQHAQSNRKNNSKNKSKRRVNNLKKDESCCTYPKGLGNQEFLKRGLNSQVSDTDKKQVKRALVNNFLKSFGRINQNDSKMKLFSPKVDTSRVTININGDGERYDVVLEQSNFDTGLSVRKTLKKQSQTSSTTDAVEVNSVENFLMLSEEIKNTPSYSRETHETTKVVPKEPILNVRDSLEIFHRREGRANSRPNLTQNKGKDDSFLNSDFKVPVKHYRGDDCSIPDPNERDKEIRELLGIERNTQNPKKSEHVGIKDHKVFYSHHENQSGKDGCCCKKRSSKRLTTGHSNSKLSKKCLRAKKSKQDISMASKTLLKKRETKKMEERETQALKRKIEFYKVAPETFSDTLADKLSDEDERCISDKQENNNLSSREVFADGPHKESFIEQNLILNRNVQVFLQLEQFTKQKPIILTRKQYEKVKRTIQCTINRRKCCNLNNFNIVSVGEIKVKPRLQSRYDREVQTDLSEIQRTVRCIQIQTQHNNYYSKIQQLKRHNIKQIESNQRQFDKMFSSDDRNNGGIISSIDKNRKIHNTEENGSNQRPVNKMVSIADINDGEMISSADRNIKRHNTKQNYPYKKQVDKTISTADRMFSSVDRNDDRIILIADRNKDRKVSTSDRNRNKDVIEKHVKPIAINPRQTVSSMEIRYANVAYMKKITVSSTHFGDGLHNKFNTNVITKPSASLHTIFKGHRKSATPNLGTSAYSLCSVANDSARSIKAPPCAGDSKPKKPFLQRLLSCLAMRSTETTVLKEVPVQKLPSVNSSVDSYHISTSLGALEMTSTLYDTSASFYSNHSIAPINKMKRGFFSSVREFLTARRS